ncbi:MAG TPA: hypothetical protein VG324_12255 [Blastocatellia bacterium]|nr:hypothetical protein [Blastocatellia bacterium]
MENELFQPDQAAQMILSVIEFIARLSGFIIAVALLVWTGGAIWIGYGERHQRRGKRIYH